ncbi:hypothetical protein DFH07DRAFT_776045 [Mycena maculata]|uniref:DUF6534 domain-containing protein n=1 Tax=Mycena maculata TaxID=230809 RepID=A0AAD7IP03_9AGAR|nr:hypothetical protein DFH07DRAFT_776045 [Mycena maculata]
MAQFQLDAPLGLGVTELGVFVTLILFGILVLQVYIYYLCTSDRPQVKTLVAVVFVAVAQAIYEWTVTLANVIEKPGSVRGLSFAMAFETLITLLAQAYFIQRVYRFSQNPWIAGFIGALSLLRFGGGIVLSVESFLNLPHEPDYFSLQDRLGWLLTATFSVGASVDVFIATSLTSQLIHRIMFWSIQTGLVTSITVRASRVFPLELITGVDVWVGVFAVLGKLYSNSLVASLNIRTLHRRAAAHARNSFALFSDDSIDGIGEEQTGVDVEFAPVSISNTYSSASLSSEAIPPHTSGGVTSGAGTNIDSISKVTKV